MILVDTSAWVEFHRATGSPVDRWLQDAIASEEPLVTTGVVTMELLAGARDDLHAGRLRRFLARWPTIPIDEPSDFEVAATIYRACRSRGRTVRRLPDCLIAAVAVRSGARLLHRDADYDSIAGVVPLEVVAVHE